MNNDLLEKLKLIIDVNIPKSNKEALWICKNIGSKICPEIWEREKQTIINKFSNINNSDKLNDKSTYVGEIDRININHPNSYLGIIHIIDKLCKNNHEKLYILQYYFQKTLNSIN